MENLEDFLVEEDPVWGTEKEKEVRRRIRASIAAYAYEKENDSVMSDADFDSLCLEIQPEMRTGNRKMDKFFRDHFSPDTGQWIHKHPEMHGIKRLYNDYYKG